MTVGIYMRYSTDAQELKVQEEDINKYVEYTFDNDVELKKYIDEGYSGKDLNRNAMERLKTDILSNSVKIVVALKLDRLSRSIQDLLQLFTFFENQNVQVHLVKEKIDTRTPQGRLLFHIMGAFAEFERETIRERLQAGREYAKKHGTKSGKPIHRPRKILNLNECIELYRKGVSLTKLGQRYKVHPATIRSRLKEASVIK